MADRDRQKLIDAYLDGELSIEQSAELQQRLAGDSDLRRQYGPLIDLLTSPEPVELPAGLHDRVLSAVHKHTACTSGGPRDPGQPHNKPRNRVWLPRTHLIAIAASIMLFVAGWLSSHLWLDYGSGQDSLDKPSVVVQVPTEAVSPWVLNALAQSLASRGAGGSITFVVQGAAIDILAEQALGEPASYEIRPTPQRVPSRQMRSAPSQEEPTQAPFPMMLPIQRL